MSCKLQSALLTEVVDLARKAALEELCDESAAVGALLSCAEMISGGVVSMSDMYFFCPALAEAMVRANFPEWHTVTIVNMAQFHKAVAM